jgi:hypothetical protein
MTTAYKVLGQSAPTANTHTTVYTVPAGNSAVVSTVTLCNTTATNVTYRLAVQPANASISTQHYIAYGATLFANDTVALTLGLTLSATDVITANIAGANCAVSVFGSEVY